MIRPAYISVRVLRGRIYLLLTRRHSVGGKLVTVAGVCRRLRICNVTHQRQQAAGQSCRNKTGPPLAAFGELGYVRLVTLGRHLVLVLFTKYIDRLKTAELFAA